VEKILIVDVRIKAMENEEKERRVQDIHLATYLISTDPVTGYPEFKIKRLEKNSRSTVIFIFADSLEVRAKIEAYFRREGRVDPVQFSENLRNLKSYARAGS
jgi:hypothetical protein